MTPSSTSLLANGPVCCVPKNVLAKIFRYISDVARPDYSSSEVTYFDNSVSRQTAKWYHFTHVCRRWRIEAIDNPSFWNVIHVGSHTIDQTQTFLERSKFVPLDVEVSCDERNAGEVKRQLEILTPHGHRIRHLIVRLECFMSLDNFTPLFKSLRDIVSLKILSFPAKANMGDFSSPNPPNPLRYLCILQLCCVLPNAQLYPYLMNVTHLAMAWSNYGTHLTWREFASFVNALQNLASLRTSGFVWSRDDARLPLAQEDIIVSPTLRTLNLSLTTNACILVLNAFELSTVSHISIVCEDYYFRNPIILPYHLSETTPCTNLSISSTANSIKFSAALNVIDVVQQLGITLLLHNIKGTLKRSWIDNIIADWLESEPLKSSHSVFKSLDHSANVGLDDDIESISLPEAVTSTDEN